MTPSALGISVQLENKSSRGKNVSRWQDGRAAREHTATKGQPRGSSLSRERDRFVVFRIRHSYAFYAGAGDKRQILIRIQQTWNLSLGEKSACYVAVRLTEFATQSSPFFYFSLFFFL